MKNIVLVRPGYSDRIYGAVYEQNKNTRREIRPPLGLMALAGYLKLFDYRLYIVDGEPELLSSDDTVPRTLGLKPDIVGVTATTPEYPFACDIIRKFKQADSSVETVLGGAHITNLPEYTVEDLADDLDWGVLYEGEKPIAAIASGDARDFCWKPELSPKLLMAPERLSGFELDAFKPDRNGLNMSQYRYVDTQVGLVQNDAIEMARGCPFGCVFCISRRTLMN